MHTLLYQSITLLPYFLTHWPLCLLACRAATKDLHSCLLWARFWMVPQVCFRAFISPSTVQCHVSLGLPLLRLPSGVQCRTVLAMSSLSLLTMCPSHLHLLLIMTVSMLSWLVWARSCLLEMVLGQNTRRSLLRFSVWNVDSLEMSLSVILQHSEP